MTAPVPARLHQPSRQPEGDGELRESERWQWGVRHAQGTRIEPDEASARYTLEWMLTRESRSRTSVPLLVRRRITDWTPVDTEATR